MTAQGRHVHNPPTILQILYRAAAEGKRGNSLAIQDGTQTYTYQQCLELSCRLSLTLRHVVTVIRARRRTGHWERDVFEHFFMEPSSICLQCLTSHGDRVVLMSRNCAEVIVAHFACAALHACIVNVNTQLKASELVHVLETSQPRVFIAETRFAPQVR